MSLSLLDDGLQTVEELLQRVVHSEIPLLYDTSHHTVTAGGKRIRPQVLLLAYLAAGGQQVVQAAPLAAAVELVHTATLVHDDINDHSPTRRGKVTVHARWGRTFALLTGDFMFAKVYAMMAPFGRDLNEIMSAACVRLVEGETLQAATVKAGEMDRETYKKIISLKTASLFEAAAHMGGLLGGGDEGTVQALRRYGSNLGLAFQIVDDILDIVGDPVKMGKPVGTDIPWKQGAVLAQNGKGDRRAEELPAPGHDPVAALMEQLRRSGAVEVARQQAAKMAGRARRALETLPPSPARQEMERLVSLVMARDR